MTLLRSLTVVAVRVAEEERRHAFTEHDDAAAGAKSRVGAEWQRGFAVLVELIGECRASLDRPAPLNAAWRSALLISPALATAPLLCGSSVSGVSFMKRD